MTIIYRRLGAAMVPELPQLSTSTSTPTRQEVMARTRIDAASSLLRPGVKISTPSTAGTASIAQTRNDGSKSVVVPKIDASNSGSVAPSSQATTRGDSPSASISSGSPSGGGGGHAVVGGGGVGTSAVPAAPPSSSVAPALVGAGAGWFIGGPIGAAVGGVAGALLARKSSGSALAAYGVIGCPAMDNGLDQLGLLVERYRDLRLNEGEFAFLAAKKFYEVESGWNGHIVAVGDACTNLLAELKKHTQWLAGQINKVKPGSVDAFLAPKDPGEGVDTLITIVKWVAGAVVVGGVIYAAGPAIRSAVSKRAARAK